MEGHQIAVPRAPQRGQHLGVLLRGNLNEGAVWHSGTSLTRECVSVSSRVHLDLWYPVPPTKGVHCHGQFTIRGYPDSPYRGAGIDQPDTEGVSALGPAL